MPARKIGEFMIKFFLILFISLSCGIYASANPSISSQLEALDSAQNIANENRRIREEEARRAYAEEQARFQEINQKRIAEENARQERILKERQLKEKAENEERLRIAKEANDERLRKEKEANEERLRDKYRREAQEDEEREFLKQQSALEVKQKELEIQKLKAQADFETAVATDRIKSVESDTAIARKKELAEVDVIQSGADVDRLVAGGVASGLSGLGNSDTYKFLVVLFLVILIVVGLTAFWVIKKNNSNKIANNSSSSDEN